MMPVDEQEIKEQLYKDYESLYKEIKSQLEEPSLLKDILTIADGLLDTKKSLLGPSPYPNLHDFKHRSTGCKFDAVARISNLFKVFTEQKLKLEKLLEAAKTEDAQVTDNTKLEELLNYVERLLDGQSRSSVLEVQFGPHSWGVFDRLEERVKEGKANDK
jgi:hypothetical protein